MKRNLSLLLAVAMLLAMAPMAFAAGEVAVTKVGTDFNDETTGEAVFTPNGGSISYEKVAGYDGQETFAAVINAPKGDTAAKPQVNFQDFDYGANAFVEFDFKASDYISGNFVALSVWRNGTTKEALDIIKGDGEGKLTFWNTGAANIEDWSYSLNKWYRVKIWLEDPVSGDKGTQRTFYFVDISYKDDVTGDIKTENVVNKSDKIPDATSYEGNIACYNNGGKIRNTSIRLDSTSAAGKIYLDNFSVKLNYTQANVTAVEVTDDEKIKVSFDKNMKADSFTDSTVALYEKDTQNTAVAFTGVLTDDEYVITPDAGFKGETTYILELKEGIKCFEEVGLADTADDSEVLYTKTFATPKDNRPTEGDVVEQGDMLKLGYAATNAATVTFTVNGTEIQGTKAARRNAFTATVDTASLPLGVVAVVTEATDADGNQIAYDKRYINVVKSSEFTSVQESTGWIQKTGIEDENSTRVESDILPKDANPNGWYVSNTDTYTIAETGYIYPYNFHQNFDKGLSGTIVMDIEMRVDTTTDSVNLSMIGNASNYDLSSSNNVVVDVFNGIFNSNGCFYKSDVEYEAGKWYAIKLVLDPESGRKAIYVDGELVYQDNFDETYMCLGYPTIRLKQTELANRTKFAGLGVDDWGIYSKGSVREQSAAYDETMVGDSRVIAETAETLSVTLNTPVTSADNAKLFVNGAEVAGALFTTGDAVTLDSTQYYRTLSVSVADKIQKGDIVEVKLVSGVSYATALNVDGTVTTAISTGTTTADITFPFIVGDADAVYTKLSVAESGAGVDAVLTSANDGNAVPAMLVIAVYEAEGKALKSVKKISASLEGENLIRLTNDTLNGGTYAKIMLWNGTTLVPLTDVHGGAIAQ